MTDLPQPLRARLCDALGLPALEAVRSIDSADAETVKILWKLRDEKLIESVLIRSGQRRTVCVSSQVGCPARCAFCASGKKGLIRNLSSGEIVEQVVRITAREPITHVVFMGMGEPLLNLEEVLRAIEAFIDPQRVGLSSRRITLSTVGIIEGIEQVRERGLRVNLVLSLHAPNQKLRQRLIPYARQYPLDELLAAMDRYSSASGRDPTYEYTLMEGINDQPEHARELAALLKSRQCTVNLIPYNRVEGLRLRRPSRGAIETFRAILDDEGIVNTCRFTKGDDIAAACGQLAVAPQNVAVREGTHG
jgi:23S rRNA (adenine2503-C2)-methyltransferase